MSAATPTCDWLVTLGIAEQEAGQPIEFAPHLATCPSCRETFAEIAAIRRELAEAPLPMPRAHWEQKVWAAVERHGATVSRKSIWTLVPILATAFAAGALALFFWRSPPAIDGPAEMALAFHFEKPAQRLTTRGDVTVGDTLVLRAQHVKAPVAQWRVYQEGIGLVSSCPDAGSCRRDGESFELRYPIPALGKFRVVLITAGEALPASRGSYDDDVGALTGQPGVTVTPASSFQVW